MDWKKPPEQALHHAAADDALARQHAEEGREAAAHSPTGVAYEKLDVNPSSIVRLGIVLVAASITVVGISYGLFLFFESREARSEPPRPPLAVREVGRIPPEPRLQTTPMSDLARLRAQQAEDLERYGWVDQPAGKVRIPVEEAMRIYAERQTARPGAPASPPVPTDASAPYPPGASGAWPGSPESGVPAGRPGLSPPEGPPASPSPAAVPTPPPHGGQE